jgi:hypothetical protein
MHVCVQAYPDRRFPPPSAPTGENKNEKEGVKIITWLVWSQRYDDLAGLSL